MCLSTLDKKPKQYKRKIGYKVFNITDSRIYGQFYGGPYKLGKWHTASKGTIQGFNYSRGTNILYKKGFHIYTKLVDAVKFRESEQVYKVQYTAIVASGQEHNFTKRTTIVARKMKILEGVKQK